MRCLNQPCGGGETQMEEAGRLLKLAVIGLAAATRTIQLVDARDGSCTAPGNRLHRPGLAAGRRSDRAEPRGQSRTAERSSSPALSRLDRRPARRMELLLQTTRPQNHAQRLESPCRYDHRLRHRNRFKCVNPVGHQRGIAGHQIAEGERPKALELNAVGSVSGPCFHPLKARSPVNSCRSTRPGPAAHSNCLAH